MGAFAWTRTSPADHGLVVSSEGVSARQGPGFLFGVTSARHDSHSFSVAKQIHCGAVPLSPRLAAVPVLEKLARVRMWIVAEPDGGFITYDRISEPVNGIYKRANVVRPPKPIYCLRHTFGTVMARLVPLSVLRELLGHADLKTTLRYIDVNEDDKRRAIATVFGCPVAGRGSQEHAGKRRDS